MVTVLVGMLFSCENKDYDTGEGSYSYLHSDYADVTVRNDVIQSIVTDDGVTLNIPQGQTVSVTPADTTLRWRLYYNKANDNSQVTLLKKNSVSILTAQTLPELYRRNPMFVMKTDTVKVNGVWISKNNKYLNMNLSLWVGNTSSLDNVQRLGLVLNRVSNVGKGRIYYTLFHDQADVPVGYYTQEALLSVRTTLQDTIDICIGKTHYVEVKH